jgi:methyl-accepting chemotaxis protein
MLQTIRGKLIALAVVVVAAIGGIYTVWSLAFNTLKVNGPVYEKIVLVKDLVADILPPPEYIIESYLVSAKALEAKGAGLSGTKDRMARLEKEYEDRHAFWKGAGLPATVADGLLSKSYGPARRFYGIVNERFIPALQTGDEAAARVAFESMTEAYEQHRAAIDEVVLAAGKLGTDTEENAAASETSNKTLVIGLSLALTLGVILVVALLIRSITGPVSRIIAVMERLARDDTSVEVLGQDRKDEVGDIARSVQVFKQNALDKKRMEAEAEAAKKKAEADHKAEMSRMAGEFETGVAGIVNNVAGASTELEHTAQTMSALAGQVSAQASAVAAASEEAAANVQTVAAATEELSSSVSEISRQVSESAKVARSAVDEAAHSDEIVRGLADAAVRIGEVVNLINDIAAQTNLLALNATIEAARAGDAGKGFAVVANEVKNLANQTARATEEIGQQITSVQTETSRAVEAIRSVGSTIGRIDEISAAIALAVEQQGAATREIARNVEEAARGTQEVSSNISGVTSAAGEAGGAAQTVLAAAQRLTGESGELRRSVSDFVAKVKNG